ncbi:hypothetical protein RHSIM_Rhsim12G0038000 [Rhododendron simsii]|uniref:Uncharacterized protein n=1 Tax=Rhododendron simsii TaxID=118357 RepID=A0A834L9V3_RHOSS|nr:hypothetical protein RHSIM_Rhsim12G0038000 [Rhododendron simsii]
MARRVLILALVLFAVVGLAYADAAADPVAASPAGGDDNDDVGTLDGETEAAPVGGPVPDGIFATNAPAPSNGRSESEKMAVVESTPGEYEYVILTLVLYYFLDI